MAIERRPVRPTTRVPQSHSSPARKPPTTRVPQRGTSRSGRAEGTTTSRGIPTQKKSNTPLIIGGAVGGAVLLIIIIAAAASGGSKRPSGASKVKGPKPVDVAQLERDGMSKCDEGCTVIQRSYGANDKAGLQRGITLITEGNAMLDRANQLSGNKYDTKRYNETLKMARTKVLELK